MLLPVRATERPAERGPRPVGGLLRRRGVSSGLLLMGERQVLFVCVKNAGRSLMAEAMFNADPPIGWRAISAGTDPAERPHPITGRLLAELGLELPSHAPQLLTPAMIAASEICVTMGCLDDARCPAHLKSSRGIDWSLPDPAALDEAGARAVRGELRERIHRLRAELQRRGGPPRPVVRSP